jgi:hypothetical protein
MVCSVLGRSEVGLHTPESRHPQANLVGVLDGGDVIRTLAHGGGKPDVARAADRDLLDLQ